MIRSKSDSLTGAFFRYGGEPGMQEKRECRRTGYAGDADGQENRLYRKSGLPRQQGGYTSNCKSGRGAYGAGKEKVWKIR